MKSINLSNFQLFLFLTAISSIATSSNSFAQNGFTQSVEHITYYSDKFHGRETESEMPYDKRLFTCAHPELAFDTVVKVQVNGRTVYCVVNDRPKNSGGKKTYMEFSKATAARIMGREDHPGGEFMHNMPTRIEVVGQVEDSGAIPKPAGMSDGDYVIWKNTVEKFRESERSKNQRDNALTDSQKLAVCQSEWKKQKLEIQNLSRMLQCTPDPTNPNRILCPTGAYVLEGLSTGGEALAGNTVKNLEQIQSALQQSSKPQATQGK